METEEPGWYGFSKPYMRLYEKDEESYRYTLRRARSLKEDESLDLVGVIPVTLDTDESQGEYDDPDAYRMYHAMRLFDSVQGFYTVSPWST